MDKVSKLAGAFFIVTAGLLILFLGYAKLGKVEPEDVYVPYIKSVVPKLTTWKISDYKDLMSEEAIRSMSKEQWDASILMVSKLGVLISIGTPVLELSSDTTGTDGQRSDATYLVPVTFDTGPADIRLYLRHRDGNVKVRGFEFLSERIFE
jgi:hypothetical protein